MDKPAKNTTNTPSITPNAGNSGSTLINIIGTLAKTVEVADSVLKAGGHREIFEWLQESNHRTPLQWWSQDSHRNPLEWLGF